MSSTRGIRLTMINFMTLEPYHHQRHRSQHVKWVGMDNPDRFEQHINDPISQARLEELGYLDPNCISYSYNSHGFRDDEFNNEPAVLALGCSFTEGVGVSCNTTWPRQLSDMMGMRVWNLGVGGSASDTAYRLAEYWLKHLDIKFVAMLVPFVDRFEIWDSGVAHVIMHNTQHTLDIDGYQKIYLASRENGQTNQNKNLHAIKHLCNEKQIPFCFQFLDHYAATWVDYGRDLAHWGTKSNKIMAEKMYNSLKDLKL